MCFGNKKKKESHYITKNPAVKEKKKSVYKLYYIESIERKREAYYI